MDPGVEVARGVGAKMNATEEIKNKMSAACAILRWELSNMWGHVSVRSPGGGGLSLRLLAGTWRTSNEGDGRKLRPHHTGARNHRHRENHRRSLYQHGATRTN